MPLVIYLSVNRRATRITAARLCIITFVMLGGAVMYVLNEFLSCSIVYIYGILQRFDGEVSTV